MTDSAEILAADLYERDGLAWSERQAALLRKVMAGERPNEAPDWPNIIDEIEAMGRSELRQCESFLIQAMLHLLKCRAWPDSEAVNHWIGETVGFLAGARRAFCPSMRQRIDLPDLYAEALERVAFMTDESGVSGALPVVCPFALDDLLVRPSAVPSLVAALRRPTP